MPGRPAFTAASSAPGATSPARLVLTNTALGFMRARSAAVTMPRVSGISRTWIDTTSDCSRKASLLAAGVNPSALAFSSEDDRPHASTFIPNALP